MADGVPYPSAGPRRIAVHGASGSGKTSFAASIAHRLNVPVLELDSIYHQPHWTPLELGEFRTLVTGFTDQSEWVCEGNYRAVRDIVWARADLIVILDLPRRTVMRRLVARTTRRLLCRVELWNGNRESFRNVISRDPVRNILRWSWRTHAQYHDDVPRAAALQATHAVLKVLRRPGDVRRFLASNALERADVTLRPPAE